MIRAYDSLGQWTILLAIVIEVIKDLGARYYAAEA